MSRIIQLIFLIGASFFFASCEQRFVSKHFHTTLKDPIDRDLNLTKDEFKEVLRPLPVPEHEKKVEKEIDFLPYSPVILAPEEPDSFGSKRVTLSITEDIPVKDVLIELARLADLEVALDPNISGGIILKVKDRPVKDVIEMVADQSGLRYSIENAVLKVQKDGPYLVNYHVDYINLSRSSKGSITTQTQVLSVDTSSGSSGGEGGSSGSGGGSSNNKGLTSGSSSEITSYYDGDLWKTIEDNVSRIVYGIDQNLAKDQASTPTANNNNTSYYTINRQANLIGVMGDSKKHKAIKRYLDQIKLNLSAQVLIEAKLIEVTLNEGYRTGINWGRTAIGHGLSLNLNYGGNTSVPTGIEKDAVFGTINSSTLNPANADAMLKAVSFLEGFGTTRVLQSPRITALNNQQASLAFAQNEPFFTVKGTTQQTSTNALNGNTSTTPVSITSTLQTIPIGIILSLQPSINLETQEITMNIRPTISTKKTDGVEDPAATILNNSISSTTTGSAAQTISSKVPIVEVREMDTVLKVRSGEVMVMGGLIQHTDVNRDTGLPGISRLPIIGNLAKEVTKQTVIKETVILIRATIVPSTGYYHPADKNLYEKLIQDTRPLTF